MSQSGAKKPIAIIGGGFAGTAMLIHTLLKIADDQTLTQPVKISLFERAPEQLHGGVAYGKGAKYKGHNLNAGAFSFDLFPGSRPPSGMPDFIEYIQMKAAEDPAKLDALTNPPRQMINDYLQHILALTKDKVGKKAVVEVALKRAVHLEDHKDGSTTVSFNDGSKLEAGHTVLSTGFQESLTPKFARAVETHPAFMDQPYSSKANPFYDEICQDPDNASKRVLIIGTGLTAMDIAARLINSGYKGEIMMVSRRGLMHKTYEPTSPEEYLQYGHMRGEARPIDVLPFSKTRPKFLEAENVADLVKGVVEEYASLRSQGYSSPEILLCWERYVPEVAERFPKALLADLFQKHEALITSSRVGVTPNTGTTVRNGIETGQIKVINGAIKDVQGNEKGGLTVSLNPSDGAIPMVKMQFEAAHNRTEQIDCDYAFSAMGNTINFATAPQDIPDPLWSALLSEGTAIPHWTKAGVNVGRDFSMIDKDGKSSPSVSVIGAPIAGHMMVTAYPYPHAPQVSGGKLGPNALGAMTIAAEVGILLEAKYEEMTAAYRPEKAPASVPVRQRQTVPAIAKG